MIEFCAISNFSFLKGGSSPEEIVKKAKELGYTGIAITDENSLAGIVRGVSRSEIPFVVGTKLVLKDTYIYAYPESLDGYKSLCRIISLGNLRSEKGNCLIEKYDLLNNLKECSLIFKDEIDKDFSHLFCSRVLRRGDPYRTNSIATNEPLYHSEERRELQDILTCIREKTTIDKAGFLLEKNAERHLKPISEFYRTFPKESIHRAFELFERVKSFSLLEVKYEYPGEKDIGFLRSETLKQAKEKYPLGIPTKVLNLLEEEFKLIEELGYEKYFLTCYDIVNFARSRGILCQGRGAAANSVVCFCLGITNVDPTKIDLLFARFVSKERLEPPDIDIDFEHERREEVIQYIYEKYGREHAALACSVITYRPRSAVRDVGKALGLSLSLVDTLAKSIHRWVSYDIPDETIKNLGLEKSALKNLIRLSSEIQGFPRHLSQHVGGFIISKTPLLELVPILNTAMDSRTMIEWDKDDLEAMGILKIDILALGMLTAIRKALSLINKDIGEIPPEDPKVYDMICKADTVGVFQIESRAQMSMLPRLKPRCFYDLVIEVAIVRPGPIHGDMVHPYLRRRRGEEKVFFPDERVKEVLGKTLGVPLFQEQAMRLAIVLAGFSPGEAEELRRAMGAWKRNKELIATFKERVISGMVGSGYSKEFAENCMNQIKGFSEYGFPESHAASFAHLVYISSWIKCFHPDAFLCGLLNSQPMGFYSPSQLIQDAQRHGVNILPIDVNYSDWESKIGVRLGMSLVKGLSQFQADIISLKRPYKSIFDLWSKTRGKGLPLLKSTLIALAKADAFMSINRSRKSALWDIKALPNDPGPLDQPESELFSFKSYPIQEEMLLDYESTGFSLRAHPVGLMRGSLKGILTSKELRERSKPKSVVTVAGLSVIRQRPQTAKGVIFITLEDETGFVNLIINNTIFEKYQRTILLENFIIARGRLEKIEDIVYVYVSEIFGRNENLELSVKSYSY